METGLMINVTYIRVVVDSVRTSFGLRVMPGSSSGEEQQAQNSAEAQNYKHLTRP